MTIRRFLIQSRYVRDGYASFDGDIYNHMVRVLRLGPGDTVLLIDEAGTELLGVIDQVAKEWVAVKIVSATPQNSVCSGTPAITICQALPKGDKIDLILQKGTELGAAEFRLFAGCRSIAKIKKDQVEAKLARWQKIVAEAARQCGRTDVPHIGWYVDAEAACSESDHEMRILLWEDERCTMLKSVIKDKDMPRKVMVAIGPEGGFDANEIRLFCSHDFQTVSLGSRILRTETASIAILSIMQYTWETL